MLSKLFQFLFICSIIVAFTSCATFSDDEEKKAAQSHLQLGVSHLNQGNFPQALKELLVAEQLDPKNPLIQNSLGLAYFVRERFDLAERHFSQAVALKNDFTDSRNNLVSTYIEEGKYDLALEEAKKVASDLTYLYPEKGQINLGIIYFKRKQFAAARVKFQKAIDLQKDNCLASSYYGRCLYELKDLKKAAQALDQAVGFCQRSQFDEPHYYSALTYYQMGQPEKAEARLQEIIKLYPQGKYVDKAKDMLETIRK